ncbi:transcription antitermination factor NusB [Candidatus Saccharibacteria bacterium]|nr:transcription antitermination factor NusB [Candidatus Saccharibacteria bacterium]
MSANRHLGRIIALQTLYEQDFRQECKDKAFSLKVVLDRNIDRYKETIDDKEFIKKIVYGVSKHRNAIDRLIQPVAPEWPIEQIARMDRTVLRIGVYELLFATEVPPKVAINEAVELAKAFGGDNSSKFINGVLGTVLRHKEAEADKLAGRKSPVRPVRLKLRVALRILEGRQAQGKKVASHKSKKIKKATTKRIK